MKHRQVKHYGYEFDYDNNGVRYDKCDPIPKEFEFILNAIQLHLKWCPNQITVNNYLPGQGKTILNLKKNIFQTCYCYTCHTLLGFGRKL